MECDIRTFACIIVSDTLVLCMYTLLIYAVAMLKCTHVSFNLTTTILFSMYACVSQPAHTPMKPTHTLVILHHLGFKVCVCVSSSSSASYS